MLSPVVVTVVDEDDGQPFACTRRRSGRPRRFTTAQKMEHVAGYERACEQGQDGRTCARKGCTHRWLVSGAGRVMLAYWPGRTSVRRSGH